nr:spore germination lipoprotein GerD [Shouchella lonarensis]
MAIVSIFLITSCAPAEGQQGADYEGTKKMVIDLLKTDEGKKALQQVIAEEDMREELVMDSEFVQKTIQETLTSKEGKEFWQKAFEDHEFAKAFSESMQEQHEKLLKDLMKDPEYQQMMMDILTDPEMEKQALSLMKSKEYREQVMEIMEEALESPNFAAKMVDLMKEANKKQKEEDKKADKKDK